MVSSSDRIFFGGFASGLDTAAIIDALIAVQTRPILLREQRVAALDNKRAALAQISSSLANLLATLDKLRDASSIAARRADVVDPDDGPKLGLSATSSAAIGSFTVDILSLATATDVTSAAAIGQAISQASPLDEAGLAIDVTAGTFSIDGTEFTIPATTFTTLVSNGATGSGVSTTATLDSAGLTITPDASGSFVINGITLSYDATTDSLDDIIARINSSSAGVTASFDTGTDELTLTRDDDGPAVITVSDTTGNFLETMNIVDGVRAKIGVEMPGTDLMSLTAVVTMINDAAMGVTASVVNDSDGRPNLLQLTSAGNIQLGAGSDTSNFLAATHLLESPSGTTRTSVRNLGAIGTSTELENARFDTAIVSTGSFKINGVEIQYDATTDSLNGIISRINESAAGVTATYDVYSDRLTIASDDTGSTAITFEDVTGNFMEAVGILDGAGALVGTESLGANASYQIDGGAIQYASSNTVTAAVAGVTLTLRETTTAAIEVRVQADIASARSQMQAFVDQYNSTATLIRESTKFVEDGDSGALIGDSTLRYLQRQLRSLITGPAFGNTSDLNSLGDIGLSFGAVGTATGDTDLLIFNTTTFDDAVKDNAEGVARLLTFFSASASLDGSSSGSLSGISGTPTSVADSGKYTLTSATNGDLTVTFTPDNGATPIVRTLTISPGEVNTTIIPGLTLTFQNPLVNGTDTITITATEEGVAKTLHEYVDRFVRSGGTMDGRDSQLEARIEDINEQIELMEVRLEAKREQLIRKFAAFEVVMQQLQTQQAALTGLINQLQANRRFS